MASTKQFAEYAVQDLFAGIAGVTSRAMFGGHGLYQRGLIFGIIVEDQIYLKVDATNQAQFEKYKSKPFVYHMPNGKTTQMSYWELPQEIIDDRDELAKWVEQSRLISDKRKKK